MEDIFLPHTLKEELSNQKGLLYEDSNRSSVCADLVSVLFGSWNYVCFAVEVSIYGDFQQNRR